jgi:hypothetical protein
MSRSRRPAVSSFEPLRQAASRFVPPYEISESSRQRLRIRLRDPDGRRPDLTLRHRHERRLFFRANYLVVESRIAGTGPPEDGELRFRFRGRLSRQQSSVRWRRPVPGGEEWTRRLEDSLLRAVGDIQAVEALRITWSSRRREWALRIETLSGSMVGGFMAMVPIAVPLDPAEAQGIIGLVDALAATAD